MDKKDKLRMAKGRISTMEKMNDKPIMITVNEQGNQMVVLPQIIFKGKQRIDWKAVEQYVLQYVGELVTIAESEDIVYIGNDFPDEFTSSVYTRALKGHQAKAKANAAQGILELLEIATDKRWSKNYKKKHNKDAEKGWYRYNTRFALPIADNDGKIVRMNIYISTIIIRHAQDGKLYLYDIQDIRKETSNPL